MSQAQQGPDFPQGALRWPSEWHEAYLDSRPDATTTYDPAAEYGDPDWREPASEAEAAARTAWLAENTPPAPGWPTRPLTRVESALEDAQERAVLSDRAHDSDPYARAEYQQLQALDRLAPLPAHDALDDLPCDEHSRPDTFAATWGWHGGDQVVRDHLADEAAFEGRDAGERFEAPDDPDRLRQRIENLRALAAQGAHEIVPDDEYRREQLARWHDDDHATHADTDSRERGGELGWGR
jgi:hypothetical protein